MISVFLIFCSNSISMRETKEKNSGPKDQVLDVIIKQIEYHKYSIFNLQYSVGHFAAYQPPCYDLSVNFSIDTRRLF